MRRKMAFACAMLLGLSTLVGCGSSESSNDSTQSSSEEAASSEEKSDSDAEESKSSNQQAASGDTITLTLWGAEEDQTYLAERVEAFKAEYSDYTFDIKIGVESESTAKDTVLTDIEAAADVFAFADDQLPDLVDAGALLSLDDMSAVLEAYANKSIDDVKSANVDVSIAAATYNDTLYAFPTSADNGYFLYYDSTVFSEDDVKTWDGLMETAEEKGGSRKVGVVFASGWYDAGFFYGAGFTTTRNEDGTTTCDWNGTSSSGVTGVQVVQAMQKIASSSAFMALTDGDGSNQMAAGNLCALVSGTWDADTVQEALGDGYAATVLPTYMAGDQEVQTGSVGGSKLIGVNAHCENSGWAVLLADFLTNEESQTIHFEERQIGPSNINAQNSEAVKENVAISTVLEQSEYAVSQKVGGKYWDPAKTFGEKIAQGAVGTDEASIQTALDELVEGITAPLS